MDSCSLPCCTRKSFSNTASKRNAKSKPTSVAFNNSGGQQRADWTFDNEKSEKTRYRFMASSDLNQYSHPATLIGNWLEERQVLERNSTPGESITKTEFAPIKDHYKKDYKTIFKHKLHYDRMTATTPNMYIAGFSNRPLGPMYKIEPDAADSSRTVDGKKSVQVQTNPNILDVTYGNDQFSHKRFGIENKNEKTSLYPY